MIRTDLLNTQNEGVLILGDVLFFLFLNGIVERRYVPYCLVNGGTCLLYRTSHETTPGQGFIRSLPAGGRDSPKFMMVYLYTY